MQSAAGKGTIGPLQQFALYYPYIHIQDPFWLKSTLLWFGQVRRIVPEQYTLTDPPEVKAFTDTPHPGGIGALLEIARLWEPAIGEAKERLQKRLEAHLPILVQKYSQPNTPVPLRNSFQIHRYKLLEAPNSMAFPNFLEQNKLAWPVQSGANASNWLAMHPKFGSAIMSTLAIAIARNEGLGIVTSNPDIHNTLIAERESDVMNVMLDLPRNTDTVPADDLSDDLAQLVFTTQFDLSSLTATDIKTLIEEKKDLAQFRTRVAQIVSDIPAGIGLSERVKRLEMKKKDVLNEWDQYRSVLPKFAKDALAETSIEESVKKAAEHLPEFIKLAGPAAVGKLSASVIGGGPGFALAVVAGAGLKMWRSKDSSLRFLSRIDSKIQKNWKRRSASLILPQWSKVAPV
jgi:hypothetical protein